MTEVVDPARRRRLNQIRDELDAVDRRAARCLYDWGRLFAEVERDELWREDGATSFSAWVDEHTDYSRTTARRAIDVARHFTVEMCERFGSKKLAAGLRYMELTQRDEQPGDLLALQIRRRNDAGRFVSKPFVDCSGKEIEAACRQLVDDEAAKHARRAAKQIDGSVRERAVQLQKVLPAAPRGTSKGDRVVVQKGRDGQLAVTFKAIPVGELRAFVEALNAHMLDE